MKEDRASATARLIARSLVFLSRDPTVSSLVPADMAEWSIPFMDPSPRRRERLLRLMEKRWFRALVWRVERRTLPGMLLHYVVRKRRLEEIARESLEGGFRQVVVLGAGFDTLALRLQPKCPKAVFCELDHPATQTVKRQTLEAREVLPPNLQLLPVDLARQELEEVLRAASGFRPATNTLFIAEGVLMYLERERVTRLFQAMRELGGPEARVAFTFMEPDARGEVRFWNQRPVIGWWLRRRGEPFRWGIRREALPGYLRENGLVCQEFVTEEGFRSRYLHTDKLKALPLAEGDHLCLATREP